MKCGTRNAECGIRIGRQTGKGLRSALLAGALGLVVAGGAVAQAPLPAGAGDAATSGPAELVPAPPAPEAAPPPAGRGPRGGGFGPGQGLGLGRGPGGGGARRGAPGGGGPGGGMGRGMGPGPGPMARQRRGMMPPPDDLPDDFRSQWATLRPARLGELTVVLERLARNYDTLETERQRLLGELTDADGALEPGVMTPAAVVRRQKVERLLGSLHDSVDQQRQIELQGGWLLGLVDQNRTEIEATLERLAATPGGGLGGRVQHWQTAMKALDAGERGRWARTLLGETLGPLALRQIGQDPGDGPLPPLGPLGELAQLRLERRQEQLETLIQQQDALRQTVAEQGREIERLRRLIEEKLGGPAQP